MALRKEKIKELEERMEQLAIREEDLVEKFILGSGKGGQKINKTYSCVYLKHEPSGIEIKCQKDRSRQLNRYYARKMLCEKLEEILDKKKSEKQQKIEKIRRQKRKRSKRAQEKMLEGKKHRSQKKQQRLKPKENHD
jgi:peptide chain release factor